MRQLPEIPKSLSHLKIDKRGYPIPYFVGYINGEPEFRLTDARKQHKCIEKKLCGICGKKITSGVYVFISGILGYTNRISSDPAMHESCARFSLEICPHLHFEKTDRRENGIEHIKQDVAGMVLTKPKILMLARADKYKDFKAEQSTLIKYHATSSEKYIYENGILTQEL